MNAVGQHRHNEYQPGVDLHDVQFICALRNKRLPHVNLTGFLFQYIGDLCPDPVNDSRW